MELGFQGDSADLERALDRLEKLKIEAVLLSLVSPGAVYPNLTLESYGYARGKDSGGLLTVSLDLVEVREIAKVPAQSGLFGRRAKPSSLPPVNCGEVPLYDVKRDDPKWTVVFKKPYNF